MSSAVAKRIPASKPARPRDDGDLIPTRAGTGPEQVPAPAEPSARGADQRRSVLLEMAARYGMEPAAFEQTLRATVVPQNCTREQFASFLLVAREYDLNPVLKQIYAMPTRNGGIQPIVGVDGWANIINAHPAFDGMEFEDHLDEGGELTAITCRIYRKDRAHPVSVTEYMAECRRGTEPWKQWPRRMLRHKAMIQAARYGFGFAGIVDPDEAERIASAIKLLQPVDRRRSHGAAEFDPFATTPIDVPAAEIRPEEVDQSPAAAPEDESQDLAN